MKYKNISCAILAGGKNLRFAGQTKALVTVGGIRIIDRILMITIPLFREIILVTNKPEEFSDYSHLKITGDVFKNAGPAGGLHAALKASSFEALFVTGCDMPFIKRELIEKQVEFFRTTGADATVPETNGMIEPLHSIYRKTVLPLLEAKLQKGTNFALNDFLQEINTKYLHLPPSSEIRISFFNINTREDLLKAELKAD